MRQNGRDKLRDRPVPRWLIWTVWGLAGYTYLVVYLGAYTRHTDSSLACSDWPLCNGSVFPGFSGPVGIVFTHRIAAFILVLGMAALLWYTVRMRDYRPDLFWGSVIALVLVIAQSIGGAAVVWSLGWMSSPPSRTARSSRSSSERWPTSVSTSCHVPRAPGWPRRHWSEAKGTARAIPGWLNGRLSVVNPRPGLDDVDALDRQ